MMRRLAAIPVLLLSMAPAAWAQCFATHTEPMDVPYQGEGYLPVITGPFLFALPEKPIALASTEGVMAVFPDRQFVSYQLITNDDIRETLDLFEAQSLSAAELDKLLYGLSVSTLGQKDQQRLESIRNDLDIDCASLSYYRVGNGVEVLFQTGRDSTAPHRMLFFSGDATNLITVQGPKDMAMRVLQSIQGRGL